MIKHLVYFLAIVVLIASCKTKKATTGDSTRTMSANKVIKKYYANKLDKETVIAKMKIKYRGKNSLPSVTASMRVRKDQTIWLSLSKLGFPIGKALITKDKVRYYEKINRTYFEGDFKLLSKWLGTELDFEKVQNLILGQAILNLKDEKYDITLQTNNFELKPRKQNDLFSILFLINASTFKIVKQQIAQDNKQKHLTINYKDYQKIEDEIFPKEIHITTLDGRYTTSIDVNYRTVEFNKRVSFPFSIPKGYKEIVLK